MRVETRTVLCYDDGTVFEPKAHHLAVIRAFYDAKRKVDAIKFARAEYGLLLVEAKNYCDQLCKDILDRQAAQLPEWMRSA